MDEGDGAACVADGLLDEERWGCGISERDGIGGGEKVGSEREEKQDGVARSGDHVQQFETPHIGEDEVGREPQGVAEAGENFRVGLERDPLVCGHGERRGGAGDGGGAGRNAGRIGGRALGGAGGMVVAMEWGGKYFVCDAQL